MKQRTHSPIILDLVVRDLSERARIGQRRYGTLLRANNGRDALWDAYEEALDLAMYLRQRIEEDLMRADRITTSQIMRDRRAIRTILLRASKPLTMAQLALQGGEELLPALRAMIVANEVVKKNGTYALTTKRARKELP